MMNPVQKYIDTLAGITASTVVTVGGGHPTAKSSLLTLDQGVTHLRDFMGRSRMSFLVGNGGSNAIASHLATDFNLSGLRSMALNCPVAATSHANDFGVEAIFTKQLEWFGRGGDTLILMSCSGNSPNIIDAALWGQANGLRVVSFTGFDPGRNKLRPLAELDFYVPAHQYGYVQLAHETILHAACDIEAWDVIAETK